VAADELDVAVVDVVTGVLETELELEELVVIVELLNVTLENVEPGAVVIGAIGVLTLSKGGTLMLPLVAEAAAEDAVVKTTIEEGTRVAVAMGGTMRLTLVGVGVTAGKEPVGAWICPSPICEIWARAEPAMTAAKTNVVKRILKLRCWSCLFFGGRESDCSLISVKRVTVVECRKGKRIRKLERIKLIK